MSTELTFGGWLRHRRNELGLTQDEFSEVMGFSPAMLRKLESGERRPSGQIATLLAGYFHVPVDERQAFVAFARANSAALAMDNAAPDGIANGSDAPWRRAYSHLTNLPAALTPLVGRDREVAAVAEQIMHPKTRLLTLTGALGVGKTRLALHVASDLVGRFEDGVFLVELGPVVDPGMVPMTIALTLGIKEAADRPLQSLLLDYVSQRRMLLVLDNFEQLLDAAPAVVKLLESSPWLKIMVTSREAMHARGEHRYTVSPLKVPAPHQASFAGLLEEYPSMRLFVDRAEAVSPEFVFDESNAGAVAEICRRLDGLPLAIELAAARCRLFHPNILLTQLQQIGHLGLLTGGGRDLPAKHTTLRSAVAWSYNLLTPSEQALFRRLGVFVGGFTPEAAAAVCNTAADFSMDPVQGIVSLLDKSLLVAVGQRAGALPREAIQETPGASGIYYESRFTMLETLRQYALEQLTLAEDGEDRKAGRRHATFFLELAERAEPQLKGPHQAAWLAHLESEYGNIREALEWAVEHDPEVMVRLMIALRRFWFLRGHYSEGSRWIEEALARVNGVTPLIQAKALWRAGEFAFQYGNYEQAKLYLEQSLLLARQLGERWLTSQVLAQLGHLALEQNNYSEARAAFEQGLVLDRELGDKVGVCWLATALGELARLEGDNQQASAYYNEGLVLAREAGDKYNIMMLTGNLGWLWLSKEEYDRATAFILESLALSRDLATRPGTIWCLAGLAGVAAGRGHLARAAKLLEAVDYLLQTIAVPLASTDRPIYERYVTLVREQLGQEAFEKARAEGHHLELEEAVCYALEEMPVAAHR